MSENLNIKQYCKIVNRHGLHTRSAAAIVELANQFTCTITVSSDKGVSDAQDMLRHMLLEASMGTEICISAIGEDAKKAVEALTNFVKAGFDELED